MSVLAFVVAGGGSYGGYQVFEDYQKYGVNFEERTHLVEKVVDGDTLIIENDIRVRLLGIDAPETGKCFGEESKQALARLVLGQEIILEKDQTARDNYDRLLRYVILHNENPELDDVFVNKELVNEGFAESSYFKPNRRYLSQLQAVQKEAEEGSLGMWSECDYKGKADSLEREQASDPFSEECVIKGNISKKYTKDYFLPGCPNYKRVKVDPRKGEKWFCSEDEAVDGGWQRSEACNNIWQTQENF